jgi:hypothetical protein
MSVRQASKHELVAAQRSRYQQVGRAEKGQILNEFVAATGYHRKHAMRLFRQGPPPARAPAAVRCSGGRRAPGGGRSQ